MKERSGVIPTLWVIHLKFPEASSIHQEYFIRIWSYSHRRHRRIVTIGHLPTRIVIDGYKLG